MEEEERGEDFLAFFSDLDEDHFFGGEEGQKGCWLKSAETCVCVSKVHPFPQPFFVVSIPATQGYFHAPDPTFALRSTI